MFGLGMGPSGHEIGDRNNVNQAAGFATGTGEGLLSKSSSFISALLSGDQSKISEVLAPFTNALQKQAGQRKATTAQFGNRGGGTNASMQAVDDSTRAQSNDAVSSLTSGALSTATSLGSGLLNTGMNGFGMTFDMDKTMHDQSAAQLNDLAQTIASMVASGAAGFAATPAGGSRVGGTLGGILGGFKG